MLKIILVIFTKIHYTEWFSVSQLIFNTTNLTSTNIVCHTFPNYRLGNEAISIMGVQL